MKIIAVFGAFLVVLQLCIVGMTGVSFTSASPQIMNADSSNALHCARADCAATGTMQCITHCIAPATIAQNQTLFSLLPIFGVLALAVTAVVVYVFSTPLSILHLRFWHSPQYLFETVALKE